VQGIASTRSSQILAVKIDKVLETHMFSTAACDLVINIPNDQLKTYQIFGFNVKSNVEFTHNLTLTSSSHDLLFLRVPEKPVQLAWEHTIPIFPGTGEPDLGVFLYRQDNFDVLHFPEVGAFYIWPEKILFHTDSQANSLTNRAHLEIHFLGTVFSFWLERQGLVALHASAIVLPQGGTAGFLATSQGGKSSLAASFLQRGGQLLTDDILPVDWADSRPMGRPGYAQMRLWPDQAEYFLGRIDHLERVHPSTTKCRVPIAMDSWGQFCTQSQPLTCLYLPERRDSTVWDTAIDISPVALPEAVIELIRQSFAAPILRAMGILPDRLLKLSHLVQQVPVRRLKYPNGMAYLSDVCQAIQEDCVNSLSV
jgi:hypothetical protein